MKKEKKNMNKNETKHTIGFFIQKITKRLRKHGEKALKEKALTYPQYYVLNLLNSGAKHSMGKLKKELSITGSGVTIIVDQLIKRGLVKRKYSDSDRRIVRTSITGKGSELIKLIHSERKHFLQTLLKTLNKDEQETITKAAELFYEALTKIEDEKDHA